MSFQIRPAVREDTPLIIGLAGATKSGKTKSAHRLAQGIAAETGGGPIIMLNAEGPRGHQYADQYRYQACDIAPPYAYRRYQEAAEAIRAATPSVLIVDSMSHAHDGPGGMLEQHEAAIDRMSGGNAKTMKERDRYTFAAWVEPKAEENAFIYTLLEMKCAIILCFRAKEKIKLDKRGGKTEVIDLGWQPISSDRVAFETLFTLMLTPHCKGVPDLALSDMREPFDTLVPAGEPISEDLGRELAKWARGGAKPAPRPAMTAAAAEHFAGVLTPEQVAAVTAKCVEKNVPVAKVLAAAGVASLKDIPAAHYDRVIARLEKS